jgi:glutathione synthase
MKIAFQMDHPARLNPRSDTTFMLIEAAQKRGHQCLFFTPAHLSLRGNELITRAQPITVDIATSPAFTLGASASVSLHAMDMVWMRQDPPFDLNYITATHLLEFILADTPVFNHPAGVRNAPEKLSPLKFLSCMPPTLISADLSEIKAFAEAHGIVVAKPLYGFGGRSIFKLDANDGNIETLIENNLERGEPPLMWQQFRAEVVNQDKRVILIDGKVESVFGRLPASDSIRANMRVGGSPTPASLNARQQEICDTIGPMLVRDGLLFVGLDLIGDYLTEINVTSPTGLRAAQALYGINVADTLLDVAEAKLPQ